jgi:hypothetical protein
MVEAGFLLTAKSVDYFAGWTYNMRIQQLNVERSKLFFEI